MATTRVVAGTVLEVADGLVTLALSTDPDTAEVLTVTAAVPVLEVGSVGYAVIGDHGAVIVPAPGSGGSSPIAVEFRTYAELRDGITVPRPPAALAADLEETPDA